MRNKKGGNMKILAINGSGRGKGNTRTLLEAMKRDLPDEVVFEIIDLSRMSFRGCIGCEGCSTSNRCVLKDDMVPVYDTIDSADALVLGSPTYFYNITANMKAFIDRLYPYEVFDPEDRSIWMSATENKGLRYAAVVAVCEQEDAQDMGFTADAMTLPLQAVGYRVVSVSKVLHLFGKNEASKANEVLDQMARAGLKL